MSKASRRVKKGGAPVPRKWVPKSKFDPGTKRKTSTLQRT